MWLLSATGAVVAQGQPPAPAGAGTTNGRPDVASYRLAVTLDPAAKQVRGSGRITYRNPSPDGLGEIWLRLYLNAFRSEDTTWLREAEEGHRGQSFDPKNPGWIRVEELRLAGSGVALPLPSGGDTDATIVRVPLPEPLGPGGTLELDVRWTSQLPRVFARTGFSGDFFMAGQWYPKLAVYDRGRWDTEPWHANAEFFHDFGTYDLAITLPKEYVTGASGVRLGEQDNGDGTKTVSYRAESVTDVAWTTWPDFRAFTRAVDAAGKSVEVELLVPPSEVEDAERHFAAIGLALDSFSRWYGVYPWPKLTVVVPPAGADGAGGMEYPSLVTTGHGGSAPLGLAAGLRELEIVTVHEIAHQWFPMQVQSNEATEPWLDEGFADYLTIRALERRYGATRSTLDWPFGRLGYAALHRASFFGGGTRQPIAQESWALSAGAYGSTVYSKGSLALLTLERTIGDERFTAAMGAYADRWRWGHPTTTGLQTVLEENLGEPLNWFFDSFVYANHVVDYRIASADASRVVVERRGQARMPVDIRLTFGDGTERTDRWDGAGEHLELSGDGLTIAAVAVDPEGKIALQLDRLNDNWVARSDLTAPLAITHRWVALIQLLSRLLGTIG
ncbi:MAG: M1 family metallopeptidase [Chloroflexi bacterium]|nr:M1 family metallopeptidase [Chloroflexota bacterium]